MQAWVWPRLCRRLSYYTDGCPSACSLPALRACEDRPARPVQKTVRSSISTSGDARAIGRALDGSPEQLLGTKLRALYQRLKGRDRDFVEALGPRRPAATAEMWSRPCAGVLRGNSKGRQWSIWGTFHTNHRRCAAVVGIASPGTITLAARCFCGKSLGLSVTMKSARPSSAQLQKRSSPGSGDS